MIRVLIEYRDDDIVAFFVEGHAGYAQKGSDIYCAGVSAVAQTALLGLLKQLEQAPHYQVEQGCLQCQLPERLSSRDRERAQTILTTMVVGLQAMEEVYGEYLKIELRRQ
ncbi:MAG: ribosomal-processing cysteine protease Prp [Syntrophomonadaceae bacterium]